MPFGLAKSPSQYYAQQAAKKKPPAPVRTSGGAMSPYVPYSAPSAPSAPTASVAPIKPPGLGPEEVNYFNSGMGRINDNYGYGLAQNAYSTDVLNQLHGRNLGDLVRQFSQLRDKLPGAFASRGLLNSGIHAGGLQQFGQEQESALGRLMLDYQSQLGQFNLEHQQLDDVRSKALADIEAQRKARLEAIAASITGAR